MLLSSTLKVLSVGIHRAKTESSSTRRGYVWVPKMGDLAEDPKEEILGNQGFRAREASYPSYYAPRGRDSSYFGLFPP